MSQEKRNLPASVAARLLNQAKQSGDDYQTLLTMYCFERFLYRLGKSTARDRFVLKGAMLLRLWSDRPYRATRDLDLLRSGDASYEAIRADIEMICEVEVEPDAVAFDVSAILIDAIRVEDDYAGTRVTLPARCGTARLNLQIDMGMGDSVWPSAMQCSYPVLLDSPPPDILAYPAEAVIAEKLEAVVVLGERNSRLKDFFDLHHLAKHFEFDRETLTESIRRTFEQRRTPVPTEAPVGLTQAYWENAGREVQLRAFARRSGLNIGDHPGPEIQDTLGQFLLPILKDLERISLSPGTWPPGGPWRYLTHHPAHDYWAACAPADTSEERTEE
jgi:hypothetical protein